MLLVKEANEILEKFNIFENVINIEGIQQYVTINCERNIYKFKTAIGNEWICRVFRESNYPKSLVERQSEFAMLLYKNNILTPWKAMSSEGYCMELCLQKKDYCVTVEQMLGQDLERVTRETFFELGKILGRAHLISEQNLIHIGRSNIGKSIVSNEARLEKVFAKAKHSILKNQGIMQAIKLHDELANELGRVWKMLPQGAVHGDLCVHNNLVQTPKGLGIIDYNLAADEVFLGDMLATLYASIHMGGQKKDFSNISKEVATVSFRGGYLTQRSLKKEEYDYYPKVAALFDGLFYCKSKIKEGNSDRGGNVLIDIEEIKKCFDVNKHQM